MKRNKSYPYMLAVALVTLSIHAMGQSISLKDLTPAPDSLFRRRSVNNSFSYYFYGVKAPGNKVIHLGSRDSLDFYIHGKYYGESQAKNIDTSFLQNSAVKFGWGSSTDYSIAGHPAKSGRTLYWAGEPPAYSERYLRMKWMNAAYTNKILTGMVLRYTYRTADSSQVDGFILQHDKQLFRVFIHVKDAKRLVKNLFPNDVIQVSADGIYDSPDLPRLSPDGLWKDGETLMIRGTVQF